MLNQLTKRGKMFLNDIEQAVKLDANPPASTSSKKPTEENNSSNSSFDVLKQNKNVLATQTPDPESFEIPPNSANDSTKSTPVLNPQSNQEQSSEKKDSENEQKIENSNAEPLVLFEGVEVPKSIAGKLRKFNKYEAKYPGMYQLFFPYTRNTFCFSTNKNFFYSNFI